MRLPLLPRILFCLLLLAGCSKEPSPEQKQADADLASAKASLASGAFASARASLLSAVAADEKLGRTSLAAEELRLLGNMYAEAAVFDSALLFYDRAAEQFRGLANRAGAREITLEIAAIHRRMGEERKAYALYSEALRFARVFHDDDGARDIEWAMLPVCRALNEREEEQRIAAELLATYTASDDANRQARVYLATGLSALHRNDRTGAARDLVSALALADQSRDSLLSATVLLQLAMTYHADGRNQEAFEAYTDALRRADRLENGQILKMEMLTRVGNIYLSGSQRSEAARFYRAALTTALNKDNKIAEGYLFIQLGHCELEPGKDAANYKSALELFRALHFAPGIAYSLRSLGYAAQRAGQTSEALQMYRQAIDALEEGFAVADEDDLYAECERSFFGGRAQPGYDDMLELLLQLNRAEDAFHYMDRRNARSLFLALSAIQPRPSNDSVASLLARYDGIRARRMGAERQLAHLYETAASWKEYTARAERELDAAGTELKEAAAVVAQASSALEPAVRPAAADIDAVRRSLAPDEALVQYIPTRRTLYALVATRKRLSVEIAAIERDRLTALAREFLSLLQSDEQRPDSVRNLAAPGEQRTRDVSAALYDAMVRPVERSLGGMTQILILLPDGFPLVPVHALRSATRGSGYLAQRYSVRYLPSARSVLLARAAGAPVRNIIGLGFPGSTDWDVEYELRDLRAFFKETRLYFGPQATLATLQKERADLAALAAEVRFAPRAPGNSYLFLSDGKSPALPRRVMLGELASLPPYETVVLSNLAPGPPEIHPAEPYLFLANGTSAVVINSYAPSRKTKKFFGEQFYTALLGGSATTAAFRKAQLEMIRTAGYAAPHCWAPFFLWGH